MSLVDRINEFFNIVSKSIFTNINRNKIDLECGLSEIMDILKKIKKNENSLYIVGNGGSAAVASHALVDFVNVATICAQVLHESSLITCMANDYGYENAYARILETYMAPEDCLIAISSSGKSDNICNAAISAKKKGATVITFSGFNADNPLRQLGDINIWLDSCDYGFVEVGHQFILHNLSDRFGIENTKKTAHETEAYV